MTEDHGVIVAALTPRGQKGDLDFGAAFELIDHLFAAQVRGIALFTAAGEYPAFSLEERTRVLYLAAKRSRVPLYAGVGSIGLDDSLSLAREARRAGAARVCLPPPHFFRYPQEEIREFYLQFGLDPLRGLIFVTQRFHGRGINLCQVHSPIRFGGRQARMLCQPPGQSALWNANLFRNL